VELDDSRLNAKIRNCQNRKIPYMLVVGQREADEGAVSIRRRDGVQMEAMKTGDFAAYAEKKIRDMDLDL
jgi:threonyl-tRNA synthetase